MFIRYVYPAFIAMVVAATTKEQFAELGKLFEANCLKIDRDNVDSMSKQIQREFTKALHEVTGINLIELFPQKFDQEKQPMITSLCDINNVLSTQ